MLKELVRYVPSVTGVAALVAWLVALQQALPRLMAGPICSTGQDVWAFGGHCPACYVAALLSVAFVASLFVVGQQTRRDSLAVSPVRAAR
jgi:hypothetical protein